MSSWVKYPAGARSIDSGKPIDAPTLSALEAPLSPQLPYRLPFPYVEPAVAVADGVIITAVSLLTNIGYQAILGNPRANVEVALAVGILVFANFCALLIAQHNYRPTYLINFGRQLRYVTLTWWLIFTFLAGIAFTLKIAETFSRGAVLLFFVVGWMSLVGFRRAVSQGLKRALERGGFAERKIILISEPGYNKSQPITDLRKCGYLPVKTYEISESEFDAVGISKSLKTKLDDIVAVCRREAIEFILLRIDWSQSRFIDELTRMLRILPLSVRLLPDENVSQLLTARTVQFGTTWAAQLQRAPMSSFELAAKRLFDLIGATVALILLAPLLLIVALLIKIDSRGPVLFKQRRSGFNEHTFTIYKFRSMHVLEDGAVIVQATRHDHRFTRLGRWLRRTNIDELPQLFNVISGDMSLVGPRPHAVAHTNQYDKLIAKYAFRHHVKPGITGWAQANGYRGETKTVDMMEQRVEHDIWYINHWSVWLDLRILLKTMLLAWRQPTAY